MAKLSTVAAVEPHEDIYTAPTPKPAIMVPATPRFLYFARADRPCVMHGRVIPSLAKLVIEPGVNLVGPKGQIQAAVHARTQRGWTLVDPAIDGEGTSYAVKRYNHLGEAVWLDQHEVVYYGSDKIGDGSEAYSVWLAGLVADGKVEAPLDYIVEGLKADMESAADALIDRDNRSEASELRVLQANIKACEDYLTATTAALEPVPAPKRKGTK